ncbi:MAG: hypothetical protein H6Q04_3240 [Acidobacteria bacterium]|jgi:hypothetical protein|nr:hypothetical protein [Acidobacteriota bacterium]
MSTPHIELLVEEPSAEAALIELIPKIIGSRATWAIHPHQGKKDLLNKLPQRLRGYASWLPHNAYIVVLIDEDRENCKRLKQQLENAASDARLSTRNSPINGTRIQVVNRIAVEELEAWFFGDAPAIMQAYPGIPPSLSQKAKYREPDAIAGGTWEALERVLQRAGYFKAGLAKIDAARSIARKMDPQQNRSRSFRCFRDALLMLLPTEDPQAGF